MSNQKRELWQEGTTDAPLPPSVSEHDQKTTSARFYVEQYQKLGPIFRLPRPEKPPLTILAGPEANIFIARYEDKFFTTQEHWQELYDKFGALKMVRKRDGNDNRAYRAKSSRYYSRAHAFDHLPDMVEITRERIQWNVGENVLALPHMQRIVAAQLGEVLVSYKPDDYVADMIIYLQTIRSKARQPGTVDLMAPENQHVTKRMRELSQLLIDMHQKTPSPSGKPDLVDEMLADAEKYPDVFNKNLWSSIVLTPFMAGMSAANASCLILYALLKHQSVYERVLVEVDNIFSQGPLTREKLNAMPTLHSAVTETLRLYPVSSGHMTRVAKPVTFAGYCLNPGDEVWVAMTVSHFLPELFPEPESFDIQRFARNEYRQQGAYAPFGLGDHTCLGSGIAEVQLVIIIATILHTYQLDLESPDYSLDTSPLTALKDDFYIKVVARRQHTHKG